MQEKQIEPFEAAKVLRNGIRQDIISILLEEKEMYISDLADEIGMDWGTVSYHIGILDNADIIETEYRFTHSSKGKTVCYATLDLAVLDQYQEADKKMPSNVKES
ncbi:winged helix-turn-helix transcriptional regulator [Candidatus Pacearchaeota archaeon]|nr:winged helix-turn-helix transcriptional regulator [Candidatus Pacearchaeota archaeon]